MQSTANDIIGELPASCFVCPLQGCSERFDSYSTLHDLWIHCASDKPHRQGLFRQGHLPCELGCQQGFADMAHRLLHYSEMKCIKDELPKGNCTQPGCLWVQTGKTSEDQVRGNLLRHYIGKHGPPMDIADVELKDDVWQLGFVDKATMLHHMLRGVACRGTITRANRDTPHMDKVLNQLPGHDNIHPIPHPVISKHLLIGGGLQHDPLMCRPELTAESLLHEHYPPALQDKDETEDYIKWRMAIRPTLVQLPTVRSRIIYGGDAHTRVWFVTDVDTTFSNDAETNSIPTRITDEENGPSMVFEPYLYTMPGYQGFKKNPITVLKFYNHMEEDGHARWLFTISANTYYLGCEEGFLNGYFLRRHYVEVHALEAALIQLKLSHAQKLELSSAL
jgi:hypothetical protein